jgi:hypothetical protein
MARITTIGLTFLALATPVSEPSLAQSGNRPVLFALQRSERLHAFDAETLQHLGYFKTGPLGDSLGVRPDGRRVFLHQPQALPDGSIGCCSLRTIDLATREMCSMSDFAGPITMGPGIVASGERLFNAQTLEEMLVPRGFFQAYVSKFSPDGRHTARIDRGPVLVFTDLVSRTRKEIPIPAEARAGDWIGSRFALIAADGGTGRIWLVSPADVSLTAPRTVTWPEPGARPGSTFAVGTDLVTHMRFGGSLMQDARERDPKTPGGLLVIPSMGGAARRIAGAIYFAALIPGQDGRSMYGMEAGPLNGPAAPVRLLRLDARTGSVLSSIVLNDSKVFPAAWWDPWSLGLANVPSNLVPKGEVQLAACSR